MRQKTIKNTVSISGVGLQTGKNVNVTFKSAPENSGINFVRTDLPNSPLLNIRSLDLKISMPIFERRTTLGTGPLQIQTTEHLLAALSGLSIDNILIEIDNVELPGLDGSAKGYVEALKNAGITEQASEKKVCRITEPLWCKGKDNILAIFPDEDFKISYTMAYKNEALGTRLFDITVDERSFEKDIAPARTFCLEEEAEELLKRGLGKGANYENTLVIGKDGPVKNSFRFIDEPVRHKVLDLIGDLYIIGMPIKGHVVAVKSGHKLNMELVSKIKKNL